MPRLRNATTGVVVNVSDEKAERLGSGWAPLDQPAAGSADDGGEAKKATTAGKRRTGTVRAAK
ncbi:hypothetical protein [Micromonospora sp. NPDC005299]|uniref:DUF7302 family protein n=1 Tax=Micromonospora sp. NPDC005299 TaxID=3364231 RepID=UPI0036CAD52E